MIAGEGAWWRDAVFYQVYVRSFADADGDGIGDLAGLRARLPYLADLGVDALWLTPFYPSPMADGGYDVSRLPRRRPAVRHPRRPRRAGRGRAPARRAGDRRPGAQPHLRSAPVVPGRRWPPAREARRGSATSSGTGAGRRREPPNNWQSQFRRPAPGPGSPDGQWYLHLFAPEQPDLNWRNPEVRRRVRLTCASGSTAASTGSASTSRTAWSRHERLPDNPGRSDQSAVRPRRGCRSWDQDRGARDLPALARVLDSYAGERIAVGEVWVRQRRGPGALRPAR